MEYDETNDEALEEESPPPDEEVVCDEGAPEWVVTFGDMMSLLLTFFILLLSFAQMERVRYKVFSGSVMRAFGVQEVIPVFNRPQADNIVATEFSMNFSSSRVFDGMRAAMNRHQSTAPAGRVQVELFEDYRGVVLSIGEEEMFEPGQPDIRPVMWPFLDDVLDTAVFNNCQIQVEAHTDNTPIRSTVYPTNDHLAAARAVSVVRYTLGRQPKLEPHRMEAIPLGPTQPRFPNIGERNRRRNRRVEFVFSATPRDFRRRSR